MPNISNVLIDVKYQGRIPNNFEHLSPNCGSLSYIDGQVYDGRTLVTIIHRRYDIDCVNNGLMGEQARNID